MPRIRFSLAALVAVVCLVAVACAALRFATELWASTIWTATLLFLLFAVLAAIVTRDDRRAFWAGVLVFGWGYLLLVFGPWFADKVAPQLVTTKLLGRAHQQVARLNGSDPTQEKLLIRGKLLDASPTQSAVANGLIYLRRKQPNPNLPAGVALMDCDNDGFLDLYLANGSASMTNLALFGLLQAAGPPYEHFMRIGHCLVALLLAWLAGLAARRMSRPIATKPLAS